MRESLKPQLYISSILFSVHLATGHVEKKNRRREGAGRLKNDPQEPPQEALKTLIFLNVPCGLLVFNKNEQTVRDIRKKTYATSKQQGSDKEATSKQHLSNE